MMDFGKPSAEQLRILSFLLSENFVGGVELRKQIAYCSTRAVPGEDTFEIRVDSHAPKALVEVHIPVEAHYNNLERSRALGSSGGPGGLVEFWLHVSDDGFLEEVEQILALPRELLEPLPDITEFELKIREWTFLE